MGRRCKIDNIRRLAEVFIIVIDFTDEQFALFVESLQEETKNNYRSDIVHKAIDNLIRIREQGSH